MTAVYGLKFVLVGDPDVGKSQLLRIFTNKTFNGDIKPTVGMEFGSRELPFERCTIKAQIWDTAGQDRPEKMTKAFFRDSLGAFVIFDLCNQKSFNRLKTHWLPQIRTFGHENMPCILVGNKSDKAGREVSIADAKMFAKEFKMDYIETSCLDSTGVEIAFRRLLIIVASMLPAVKTHLELTNLPEGWICRSHSSPSRAVSMDFAVTESNKLSIASSLPVTTSHSNGYTSHSSSPGGVATHPHALIGSKKPFSELTIHVDSPQSSCGNLPGVPGGLSLALAGKDVFPSGDIFINYWTGDEQSIRPTLPADPQLLYDAILEERKAEMEARESLQLANANRAAAAADEASRSASGTNRTVSRSAIDIQQRDSLNSPNVRRSSSTTSECFCTIM